MWKPESEILSNIRKGRQAGIAGKASRTKTNKESVYIDIDHDDGMGRSAKTLSRSIKTEKLFKSTILENEEKIEKTVVKSDGCCCFIF